MIIAGSDSGGGAGLQADLKTVFAHRAHGSCAVTAVTVQNSLGVSRFYELPPHAVREQIEAVVTDIGTDVVKTGMLASAQIIRSVVAALRNIDAPVVVDPVAASQHGDPLLRADALAALRELLLPAATVVTPNLAEVRLLTGMEVTERGEMLEAARAIKALGPRWVLIKGGHIPAGESATDLLFDGTTGVALSTRRWNTVHTHGSGDTLASALAARLALGDDVPDAARAAKAFVAGAIAAGYPLGHGLGPVDPGWRLPEPRSDAGADAVRGY